MAAEVSSHGAVFEVGNRSRLFNPRMRDQMVGIPYDVSADGEHFLVNTLPDRVVSSPITLVVNWPGLLKR